MDYAEQVGYCLILKPAWQKCILPHESDQNNNLAAPHLDRLDHAQKLSGQTGAPEIRQACAAAKNGEVSPMFRSHTRSCCGLS